jgi:copper chaperone CopZ
MKSLITILLMFLAASTQAGELTLRVTGLFSKDRVDDLRRAVEMIERVEIKSIDYETAKVTFIFETGDEPFKSNAAPEQILSAIDSKVKKATRHTMTALLPTEVPKDKLARIEIEVVGLDCKACSYAAYRAIYQIEGVARATASFKDGKVTALIDPKETNRPALEEALKKKGVILKSTESK